MDTNRIFDYKDESQKDRLERKTKESPYMVAGIIGFTFIVGLGIYKFKTRPAHVSASLYFTQLRVISQGVVVGALTGGVIYQLGTEFLSSRKTDDKKE